MTRKRDTHRMAETACPAPFMGGSVGAADLPETEVTEAKQALLPVTPERNSPERKRARLLRRFDEFAEAAAAATPGGWHRTHGVIASVVTHIHDDRKKVDVDRYVVATADVARVNLMGHEPDIARESANARWITLASPRNILSLIEAFREHLENDDLLADANGHYSGVQLEEMNARISHSLPGDVDEAARAAYAAHCAADPCNDFSEPDWSDGGYSAESFVWQAVAKSVLRHAPAIAGMQPYVAEAAEIAKRQHPWGFSDVSAAQKLLTKIAALTPSAISDEGEFGRMKTEEARIMQDWRWGNLTTLGVANHLRRAGFDLRYATDKANALTPSPKCMTCGCGPFETPSLTEGGNCISCDSLTPSPCPGDVGDEEQPGDYLRDELLNIAAICEAKALHVEAASLRSTAAIVSEQLRKGQQASAGHVKLLRGLLKEFVEAMERYQMDVDDDAPPRHRDMMDRAYAALTPSALSGDAGEGELPADVRRLVIAARTIAFNDWDGDSEEWTVARKELDDASEAFASRVPWEDE